MVVCDTIDDQMRAEGMKPDRRIDLGPLPGDLGIAAQKQKLFAKTAQVAVGLIR